MIRCLSLVVIISAITCFGAQGSGIYFEGHVSRSAHSGDTIYAGVMNGLMPTLVEYQYCVRYAFSAGYELSFNKVISIRGGVGYQNALLDAYGGIIRSNTVEEPLISKTIERHWLTVPIDFKVTLPFRRSGVYLAVGPIASFLLSSTYKDSITNTKIDFTDDTPGFNFSLGGSLGFEFAIGKFGHLLIESGYHHALINTSMISGRNTKESEINLLGLGFRVNFPSE